MGEGYRKYWRRALFVIAVLVFGVGFRAMAAQRDGTSGQFWAIGAWTVGFMVAVGGLIVLGFLVTPALAKRRLQSNYPSDLIFVGIRKSDSNNILSDAVRLDRNHSIKLPTYFPVKVGSDGVTFWSTFNPPTLLVSLPWSRITVGSAFDTVDNSIQLPCVAIRIDGIPDELWIYPSVGGIRGLFPMDESRLVDLLISIREHQPA